MALHLALRATCRNPAFMSGVVNIARSASTTGQPWSRALLAASKASPVLSANVRKFALTPIRSSAATGNHVTLWNAERALSVALLGMLPVGLLYPSQIGDGLIAVCIVMHQHWGLEAIVTDYVRPILFGATVPKLAHGLLLLVSAATLGGLFYFNYNDIGIAQCVRKIWATKPKQ